jgi:hypothetical protein
MLNFGRLMAQMSHSLPRHMYSLVMFEIKMLDHCSSYVPSTFCYEKWQGSESLHIVLRVNRATVLYSTSRNTVTTFLLR